ncbi:MAG TPA: YggS family pyridoxal phosphate-dependent enzyme [Gammaproteobacteria bacterium]
MTEITDHFAHIRERVALAARRSAKHVMIVAVSKGQPAEAIDRVYAAGQRHFGESYVQEALPKIEALRGRDIEWHFIGRVQANKTRPIAEHFHWVHTVDREKVAVRLNDARPHYAPPLNVLLQVNLAGEPQKGGVSEAELAPLVAAVSRLPRLALRGLMTIPPAEASADESAALFDRLKSLQDRFAAEHPGMDVLSMGMSGDFELAIACGSTCVRIGTAIFGPRRR